MSSSKIAVFAGGCFWGLEELLRQIPGVLDTEAGYTGGKNSSPNYEFHPGHAEAVQITYDPTLVSYEALLDRFFHMHNPTTVNRQGNDVGEAYRSAIFYGNEEEKRQAQEMIERVNASGDWSQPVATTLEPLTTFWRAESYHQDYLQRYPDGYTCHALRKGTYL